MSPRVLELLYGLSARSWSVAAAGDPLGVELRIRGAMSPPTTRWLSPFEWEKTAQLRVDSRGCEYVRLSRFGGFGNFRGLRDRLYLTFGPCAAGGTSVNVTQRATRFLHVYFGLWLTAAWIIAVVLLVLGIVHREPVALLGFVLPLFGRLLIVEAGRRADARAFRRWLRRALR
jgi:hypothetical protein